MPAPNQNWWTDSSPAFNSPGGTTYGGGGSLDMASYHYELDARRSLATSDAQYPDGYLGTITDRRQDRLLQTLQRRLTARSYQRGVHVGSKIGHDQYFWPKDFDPDSGIERQAATAIMDGYTIDVQRFAPTGNPVELLAHEGKTAGMSPPGAEAIYRRYGVDPSVNQVVLQDPDRKARMQKMLPNYAR